MNPCADVFDGIDQLPGEVFPEVDLSVRPVQIPPRGLLLPIKHKVQDDLKKLENDVIMIPVVARDNSPLNDITVNAGLGDLDVKC